MRVKEFFSVLVVAALGALATPAQAQWTGKAELGVLLSSGNTESKSANGKFDLTHENTRWRNNIFVGALYGENATFTDAERYEARYQSDYKITERFSWFGGLRGEQDRFSGFAYQATVSTGASYKFIDKPSAKLTASLGAGLRRSQSEILIQTEAGEVLDRIEGPVEEEPVIIFGSNYEQELTSTTKITNKLLAESGSDNTSIQNDLALSVSINESFALAVGYAIRYNTDPPPLSESTDSLITVNLVYNIQ